VRLSIRDAAGETVQLIRSGSEWVLADTDGYPALEGAVPELLDKLVALKKGRLVAETEESHAQLKVAEDEYVAEVELLLEDNSLRKLYVGSSPSYGASHVRVAEQNEVYLVSDLSSTDASARVSSWIDTSYLQLDAQEFVAATLENANGTFEFVKVGEEWAMAGLGEGETASSANISTLISRAASVRMVRPLGTELKPSYGLQAPSATLVIRARSAEGTESTYTMLVGAQSPDDGSYVFKSSESPYYVRVAEYTALDWVGETREGLLETPDAG